MSSEQINIDEHAAKKSRKNDDSVVVESVDEGNDAAESKDDSNVKKSVESVTCVLCMEEGTPLNPILETHQCPQCSPGAWNICHVCNEALLSRLCPVCRSDYAPIVMHTMPGLPFKRLADSTLSEEEKSSLLYKFGIVRQMIAKSNVSVWSPSKARMYFSLPSKLIDSGTNEEATTYIVTSVPMAEAEAGLHSFNFTNKVWDLIENEVENGAVQAGESVDYQGAAQYILNVTREDGHRLYSMLSPSDWDYMLNPDTSSDITETLKSIKMNILQKVESIIPKKSDDNTASTANASADSSSK